MKYHLGKNWSFKVRTRKSNLFGLNDFALMHAKRRNYLLEWYARKMFEEEGFIYKDYKFINLYINGENKGIYGPIDADAALLADKLLVKKVLGRNACDIILQGED